MITIFDTGPLAYLNRNDPHHVGCRADETGTGSDACVRTRTHGSCQREDGLAIDPCFNCLNQMDLADASVVVMAGVHAQSQVLTIDRGDQFRLTQKG
jgi:hypothetical protein